MAVGGASNVVSLLEAGIPLVETQADLTPFQRHFILKELERREQEKAAQMDGSQGAGSPGATNQLHQPKAGGGGGETVTYVNEHGS